MAKFGNVDVHTSSFRPMRNTISGNAMRTFMKLVVAADTDVVVGCHMVGDDSAEIMQVRPGCCLLRCCFCCDQAACLTQSACSPSM